MILRFLSLILFVEYLFSFYEVFLRANNQFAMISRATLLGGICSALSILLILGLGLRGFLLGQLLRLVVMTAFYAAKRVYVPRWSWNGAIIRRLVAIGFPIMLMVFSSALLTTIDRFLILRFLDTRSLGLYSLGAIVFAPLLLVFSAANSVMYPRFAERYGHSGNSEDLKPYIAVPMQLLAVSMAVVVGAVYIALPWFVTTFLPKYAEGIPAARVLLFGLFFFAVSGMAGNMLLTVNKQVHRIGVLLLSAAVNLALGYTVMVQGRGLVALALCSSVAYLTFFLASGFLAFQSAHASFGYAARAMARAVLPLLYVCGAVCLVGRLFPLGSTEGAFARTLAQEAAFLVSCTGLIVWLVRRSGILSMMRRA
jgi:O-antigen/teichoic acid export membrane protein